jgi:uncharacterized protein (DUF58 family)
MSLFPFKPVPAPATATLVRRRPSLDFSITGLIYCSMMMFMGLAAINSQANLLFGVFGLMIGILVVSGTVSRIVLKRILVVRVLPKHGVVGESMTAYYEITNAKRFWPSLSVTLAELDGVEGFTKQPQCYMLHAAPKMTASVPAELIPKRRGLHELGRYQLATSFPFGFIKRAFIERHKDVILIFPALAQVDGRLLAMCRSADNTGESIRPRPGGADEFYGLKEFRTGDNPRHIYWRRSARTGVLVSKEMTRVAPPRLLLMVDTWLPNRTPANHALVERNIAAAGSLAAAALDQGLSVGLCVWSNGPVSIVPTRGKQQREDALTLLARLPLNTQFTTMQLLDEFQNLMKPGTTIVLLTPNNPAPGLADHARGGMLVLRADDDSSRQYFRFGAEVNFGNCMPPDQEGSKVQGFKGSRERLNL